MAYESQIRDALSLMFRMMEDKAAFDTNAGAQSCKVGEQIRLVEQLAGNLPDEAPEMLRHFMEKKSYAKALDLLLDRMPPVERAAWRPGC